MTAAARAWTEDYWPGLDYARFPKTEDEWLAALCAKDTGYVDCLASFLLPYVVKDLAPNGTLKKVRPPWTTPLKLAKFEFAFDLDAPRPPWADTGVSPQDVLAFRQEQARAAEQEARQATEAEQLHRSAGPYVYFIGGEVGAIKIGYSKAPKERLTTLQIGSPIPLAILASFAGSMADEARLHERYAAHRLHGEWFERHPDILEEIERLTK